MHIFRFSSAVVKAGIEVQGDFIHLDISNCWQLSLFYLSSCPRPPSFYWKMLEKLRSVVFFKQYIMQCSCPSQLHTLLGPVVKTGRRKKPKITKLRTAEGVYYKNNSVKNMVHVFIFSFCRQKSWLRLWWYFPWCSTLYGEAWRYAIIVYMLEG